MIRVMKAGNRLYLARHGQVKGYERFPIYGHTDVELTDEGRIQMEALAERLRHNRISAVFSSDLRRSLVGAKIIGRHHEVPVLSLPELREMNFGAWEGLTLGEVQERFPGELLEREKNLAAYRMPGGGESLTAFSRRILSCMSEILDKREGENLLLVAHGMVNRVILSDALGLDLSRIFALHQEYGCLNIIDYFPDASLVRLVNG
ncbi:MAG: histidine phosphatase family protein [Thermodesulfobacteriota bacterium]